MSHSSSARAKRARDHLARKRRQEMQRLERERRRAENSESRAQVRGILPPILFGLSVSLGLLLASPVAEFFLLRDTPLVRVAVQGASALQPVAIATSAGVTAGHPLHAIDPARVRETLAANPWIESARTLRLPDGTLVVSIVEKRAMARWQTDASRRIELIDDRGRRFAGATEPGGPLPLIRGAIAGNGMLPESAVEILDELRHHARLGGDPTALTLYLPADAPDSIDDEHSGYVLQVGDDGPRALLGRRLLSQRIARLAALLENEDARFAETRWIDLRYADRAVLRTEPVSG